MTDVDEWESRFINQTAQLSAHIELLAAIPRSRRRRFRLLEWVCASCGDPVVEVLNTDPYRTLLARGNPTQALTEDAPDPQRSTEEYIRWRMRQPQSIRRGELWWAPLASEPSTDSSRAIIQATCGCRQRTLDEQTLFEDLAARRKKRVLH